MKIKDICAMVETHNKVAEHIHGEKAIVCFTSGFNYYYIKDYEDFKKMLRREYIKEAVKSILAEDFEIDHEKQVYWEVQRNGRFVCSGFTPVHIGIETDD